MSDRGLDWQQKGAAMSDKHARQEFGLTQEEVYAGIRSGALQYQKASMHGNPWLRLLRREVEVFARQLHGKDAIDSNLAKAELAKVDRELRSLRRKITGLEKRKAELTALLEA